MDLEQYEMESFVDFFFFLKDLPNHDSFPFYISAKAVTKTSVTPKCHLLLTLTLIIIADSEKPSTMLEG